MLVLHQSFFYVGTSSGVPLIINMHKVVREILFARFNPVQNRLKPRQHKIYFCFPYIRWGLNFLSNQCHHYRKLIIANNYSTECDTGKTKITYYYAASLKHDLTRLNGLTTLPTELSWHGCLTPKSSNTLST